MESREKEWGAPQLGDGYDPVWLKAKTSRKRGLRRGERPRRNRGPNDPRLKAQLRSVREVGVSACTARFTTVYPSAMRPFLGRRRQGCQGCEASEGPKALDAPGGGVLG